MTEASSVSGWLYLETLSPASVGKLKAEVVARLGPKGQAVASLTPARARLLVSVCPGGAEQIGF